jgi:hypothetical protein
VSDEATIRTAIKTAVESVPDVGLVYDWQRAAVTWDRFLELFKTAIGGSPVIRGWCITCEEAPLRRITFGGNSAGWLKVYGYKVRGYFSVSDEAESEKAAFLIAEAVAEQLTDLVSAHVHDNMPSLDVFDYRLFGSVLCHFAEISLSVRDTFDG